VLGGCGISEHVRPKDPTNIYRGYARATLLLYLIWSQVFGANYGTNIGSSALLNPFAGSAIPEIEIRNITHVLKLHSIA